MTLVRTMRGAAVVAALILSSACAARVPAGGSGALPPGTGTVAVQLLAINDFHGTLEPATGGNGRIGTTDAGGVEFLSTHLARLRAANPNTITVSAGDNIGASTLLSGMFHDEPTIEALSDAGLQVSTVGNHEFDEGWAELVRMQRGGCHPVDGCQDMTPFAGAKFEYLSANVGFDPSQADAATLRRSGWTPRGSGPQTLFPSSTVREIGGVKVGFIGLVLQGTKDVVSPAGVRGLTFGSEVETGNAAAAALVRQGVKTIVVLIHEGGTPATADPDGCGVTGPIVAIANGFSPDIDVVVSGHTHRAYICTIGGKLVTSASSLGRLITDIDLTIDRATGDVVSKTAHNVIVTRDVPRDTRQTQIIEHYRPFYRTLGERPVGGITAALTRVPSPAGESALGDVIADALLDAASAPAAGAAVAAFWNPGGIRSDLVGRDPATAGAPRPVTFANAFDVMPFGNRVIIRTMTGDAIVRMLEQQFDNPDPGSAKMLQVAGLTYTFDAARPRGQRVDVGSIMLAGRALDRSARYRLASSDFVWSGGDAFAAATEGTDPLDVGADVDVLIAYLQKHSPVAPGPQNRVVRR